MRQPGPGGGSTDSDEDSNDGGGSDSIYGGDRRLADSGGETPDNYESPGDDDSGSSGSSSSTDDDNDSSGGGSDSVYGGDRRLAGDGPSETEPSDSDDTSGSDTSDSSSDGSDTGTEGGSDSQYGGDRRLAGDGPSETEPSETTDDTETDTSGGGSDSMYGGDRRLADDGPSETEPSDPTDGTRSDASGGGSESVYGGDRRLARGQPQTTTPPDADQDDGAAGGSDSIYGGDRRLARGDTDPATADADATAGRPPSQRRDTAAGPDPASDRTIRQALREQAAAQTDYAAGQYIVTGFEQTDDGQLRPEFALRGRRPGEEAPEVPESFRDQLAASSIQGSGVDEDDAVITGTRETEEGVMFDIGIAPDAQRQAAREQFAERFSEQTGQEIDPSDIALERTDDGFSGRIRQEVLRQQAAEQLSEETGREIDPSDIELEQTEGGYAASFVDDAEQAAPSEEEATQRSIARDETMPGFVATGDVFESETQAAERSRTEEGAFPEPGPVAEVLGGGIEAVADSPIGSTLSAGADFVFEDRDDGDESPAQQIDNFLEEYDQAYQRQVVDPLEQADADRVDPESYGLVRPFGATGQDIRDTAAQTARFANVPGAFRDVITVGELSVQGAEFAADRGPEAVEISEQLARQAPGAAVDAAQQVRENPRDAAITGTALVSTAAAGSVAAGSLRTGTTVARRGASRVARRADGSLDMRSAPARARSRAAELRERSPDVSVRRGGEGRVEVDPMLQQQLRDISEDITSRSPRGTLDNPTSRIRERGGQLSRDIRIEAARVEGALRDAAQRTPTSPQDVRQAAGRTQERLADRIGDTITRAELAARTAGRGDGAGRDLLPNRGLDDLAPSRPDVRGRITGARDSARLEARAALARAQDRYDEIGVDRSLGDITPGRPDVTGRLAGARDSARLEARAALARAQDRFGDGYSFTPDRGFGDLVPGRPDISGRVETARDSAQLEGAAFAARLQEYLDSPTPSVGVDDATDRLSSFNERLTDYTSLAREGTIRIGPMRPRRSRTTLDADEVELEAGAFPDDADQPGAAGDVEIDIDGDFGGSGGWGSGQQSAFRSRMGEADSDAAADAAAATASQGTGRVSGGGGLFGGFGAVDYSTFESPGGTMGESTEPTSLDGFDVAGSEAVTQLEESAVGTSFDEVTEVSTGTDVTTGLDDLFDVPLGTSTPTTTTTTTPTTTTTTTTQQTNVPSVPSGPSTPPNRIPRFDQLDGGPEDDGFTDPGFDADDEVFDTGVADPDDVLNEMFD